MERDIMLSERWERSERRGDENGSDHGAVHKAVQTLEMVLVSMAEELSPDHVRKAIDQGSVPLRPL